MEVFETKFDLLKSAYKDEKLKKSSVGLLQYLVYKSNAEQCFPAVETIAKAMNVCKRTVQYNMRKLEASGYIIRKTRYYNHQQLSNQYIFNLGVKDELQTEDKLYTSAEKEELNQCISFFKNEQEISKSKEILKIYNMRLSKYEKLLLIYLLHKSNKNALVYDEINCCMKAIGVCKITFLHLLKGLRKKGLILIHSKKINTRDLIIIKLTRSIYEENNIDEMKRMENQESVQPKIIHNKQKQTADQIPDRKSFCAKSTLCTFMKQCERTYVLAKKKLKQKLSKLKRWIGDIFSPE